MNKRKEAFLNTLRQGPFWDGEIQNSGERLCGCYFSGIVPHMLKDLKITQEKVYEHDTDECSGNLYTVWKFTIPAYNSYSGHLMSKTEHPEETFFLRFDGFYRSHEGSEYTGFQEVKPQEKFVTVYE